MSLAYPDAIVFDLDGTLLDTSIDLAGALNHCLGLSGLAPIAPERVKHLVGHGARALLGAGLAERHALSGNDAVERLVPEFMRYYAANIAHATLPYPHIVDVLEQLRRAGVALGVCTNKPIALSHQVLAATGLAGYFSAVIGGDSLPVRKPDPEPLLATCRLLGRTGSAMMVGDSEVDIIAAKAAGMKVIAVSFGFGSDTLAACNPDALIDSYADFLPTMHRLMGASAL